MRIMKDKILFCDFGCFSASCCLSLFVHRSISLRLSSYGTLSKATGFLLIARYAPSFCAATCSKTTPKSQEINL